MSRYVELNGLPPTQSGANLCLLNVSQAHLCNICEPSKLLIKLTAASFNTTVFEGPGGLLPDYGSASQNALDPDPVFSGARTGVTFEGPFIRYSIATGSMGNRHPDSIKALGVNSEASVQYFFDLMTNRTILLPWQGSVDVITQYPGQWRFEWYLLRGAMADALSNAGYPQLSGHMVRQVSPLDADATLTLRVADGGAGAGSSRTFNRPPPGGHSFTYNDTTGGTAPYPTVSIAQEDTIGRVIPAGPGAVPLTTTAALPIYSGSMATYMNRLGQHNASRIQVTQIPNINANGYLQWHLSFG